MAKRPSVLNRLKDLVGAVEVHEVRFQVKLVFDQLRDVAAFELVGEEVADRISLHFDFQGVLGLLTAKFVRRQVAVVFRGEEQLVGLHVLVLELVGIDLRHDLAVFDDGDAVTGRFDFWENVAGKQDGLAAPLLGHHELNELRLHRWIKPRGRLVQDQDLWVGQKGGDHGELTLGAKAHALGVAAGVKVKHLKQLVQVRVIFDAAHLLHGANEFPAADVLWQRNLPWQVTDVLHHLVVLGGGVKTKHADGTGARLGEASDMTNGRGLAGAVRTEEPEDFAGVDLEADVEDAAAVAKVLREMIDFQCCLCHVCLLQLTDEPSLPWIVRAAIV